MIAGRTAALGEAHPATLESMAAMADALEEAGMSDEALELLQEARRRALSDAPAAPE